MSDPNDTVVRLQLHEDGAGPEELEDLTRLLRQELGQLDVEGVEPAEDGDLPVGARGAGALAIGGLLVSIAPTAERIASLVRTIREFLGRGARQRTIRLEVDGDVLELTGTTSEMQQRLADEWIRLHTSG